MSQGLRTTFLVHAIISLVFGIGLFFVPATYADLVNWAPFDSGMTRAFGAALLAFSLSSWLGYKASNYDDVRIIVNTEILLTVLGALGSLYEVLVNKGPAFNWVSFALFLIFALLFFFNRKP